MKEEFKKEYVNILNKIEELLKIFDGMKEETKQLKNLYEKDPQDKKLLENIKLQEENYKMLYEEFEHLNKKAKELANKN